MKVEVKGGNFHYKQDKQAAATYLYQEDISFTLNKGEVMAILGPNGAGKTTLLKCITGLYPWRTGETFINDMPLATIPQQQLWKKIGYVPQAHKMVFGFSIEELVVMGRAPYISTFSNPSKKDYVHAQQALEQVGIVHLSKKSCNEVSGGELQLALIARTLVSDPELLILDEPESHLDIQKQVTILQTIKRLATEFGIGCIINTHYPNHAFYLADHVLMIAKGKQPLYGAVAEIMSEANMHYYFDIELEKIAYQSNERRYETMVPTELAMPI